MLEDWVRKNGMPRILPPPRPRRTIDYFLPVIAVACQARSLPPSPLDVNKLGHGKGSADRLGSVQLSSIISMSNESVNLPSRNTLRASRPQTAQVIVFGAIAYSESPNDSTAAKFVHSTDHGLPAAPTELDAASLRSEHRDAHRLL
jgi:hypothetical protein